MTPGGFAWFAQHELRLAWRDWLWLLSGGHRRRGIAVASGVFAFVLFMHGLAAMMLPRSVDLSAPPDRRTLTVIGFALLLYASLMLSQAMEGITRAFFARGDLDLVLSSPAAAARLFAVRIIAMAGSVATMGLLLAGPVIDVLALSKSAHWLAAYGVLAALAMTAIAVSAVSAMLLFAAFGPRRARFAAQVMAAVVGAGFVIGVQFLAILSVGTLSRIDLLSSDVVARYTPAVDSWFWLPARAAAGNWLDLSIVVAVAAAALAGAVRVCAPRFATLTLSSAAAATSAPPARPRRQRSVLRAASPAQALRCKEWALLRRDPWLVSQSLMQILYLLPAFFLLSRSFYGDGLQPAMLVPVLIMAAGQLAGGLAWLAVSGEDAPDLIGSAPVTPVAVWRAKAEAVAGVLGLVFGPAVAALAILDPGPAAVALLGVAAAAVSASMIQFWFRAQARRSLFRRRQVSSRIATFAEAFSSITWSGAGAVALINPWFAIFPGAVALAVLAGTWTISPRHA